MVSTATAAETDQLSNKTLTYDNRVTDQARTKTTDDVVDDRSAGRQQTKDRRMRSEDDESLDVTRSNTSFNVRVEHSSGRLNVV